MFVATVVQVSLQETGGLRFLNFLLFTIGTDVVTVDNNVCGCAVEVMTSRRYILW